jgi:hypothetical protein
MVYFGCLDCQITVETVKFVRVSVVCLQNLTILAVRGQSVYQVFFYIQANGFFGSKGISSAIPDAYTYIAKHFYAEVLKSSQQHRVTLHEFSRPGWTVHAKGLWFYLPGQTLPSMSMIGSPNFGKATTVD